MTTLKLRFKIEVLYKLVKNNIYEEINQSVNKSETKLKPKPLSANQSGRNSKIFTEFETLPGYDQEMSKLQIEEKEEVLNFIKKIDYNTLFTIFTLLQNKQFYLKIKSKAGLETIRNSYKEIMKIKSEFNNDLDIINIQESLFINDECELFCYLRNILNITEIDAMDLFDLFKFNEFFAITEQSFIILIYLIAAYENGFLEDFIQIFNDDLFNHISGYEKIISHSRLKEIGRFIGFSENSMTNVSTDLKLEFGSFIDNNKFREFYTLLGKMYDDQFKSQNVLILNQQQQQVKQGQQNNQSVLNKGKTQESKAKNSGCMSKACNIL